MSPAWRMSHSVEAAVDRQFAWDFWTTVDNWAVIDPGIESVRLDDTQDFRAGATGTTVTAGGGTVVHWTIVEATGPRSALLQFPSGGATLTCRWTFDVVDRSRCRITQEMTLAGLGADVIRDRVAADLRSGTGPGMSALVDAMSVGSRRVGGAAGE